MESFKKLGIRRHRNKSKTWVKAKYFRKIKERNQCFSCTVKDDKTKDTVIITLKFSSDTPIRRYVKIRGEATPFDPNYEAYFENRMSSKMANNKEGRRKVGALWKRQKGCCSICGERITSVTSWSVHYLESRMDGGSGNLSNLTLLHPDCQERGYNDGFKYLFPAGANKTPA
jgi:RNA-directed DNA polymerase